MKKLEQDKMLKLILAVIAVVALCGLSFWGGTVYQKNHTKNTVAQGQFGAGGFGGRFRNGGARPNIGTVSAVSDSSITVQTRAGNTKTFTITSNTTVTDNGATSSVSNIKSGDIVLIQVSATNTNEATRILLNPSVGGGPAVDGQSQSAPVQSN